MKQVTLDINVVPPHVDLYLLDGCDVGKIGKKCSDSGKIMFNKIGENSYTILYTSDVFETLSMSLLGKNIINLLMKNISDSEIQIGINYYYETLNDGEDMISYNTGLKIIALHVYLNKLFKERRAVNGGNVIQYIGNDVIDDVADYINNYNTKDEDDDKEDEKTNTEETILTEDDIDINDVDDVELLSKILNYTEDNDDDEDEDNDKPKRRNTSKRISSSKIFRSAKNPKRSYRRHGVIICNKKSAVKRDEKILKDFLKDFIPGNAEWKKDFRKDVLKRWMSMYYVTSNKLKQLEKEYQKSVKKQNKSSIDVDKAIDLTRRLLNVPIDMWSDPNR